MGCGQLVAVESESCMLVDPFGRTVSYLRVSVTDRCDFRCLYCMSEQMTFLPKAELLTLEELDRLCSAFVRLGVRKLRLTGGEPLVRILGTIKAGSYVYPSAAGIDKASPQPPGTNEKAPKVVHFEVRGGCKIIQQAVPHAAGSGRGRRVR